MGYDGDGDGVRVVCVSFWVVALLPFMFCVTMVMLSPSIEGTRDLWFMMI